MHTRHCVLYKQSCCSFLWWTVDQLKPTFCEHLCFVFTEAVTDIIFVFVSVSSLFLKSESLLWPKGQRTWVLASSHCWQWWEPIHTVGKYISHVCVCKSFIDFSDVLTFPFRLLILHLVAYYSTCPTMLFSSLQRACLNSCQRFHIYSEVLMESDQALSVYSGNRCLMPSH